MSTTITGDYSLDAEQLHQATLQAQANIPVVVDLGGGNHIRLFYQKMKFKFWSITKPDVALRPCQQHYLEDTTFRCGSLFKRHHLLPRTGPEQDSIFTQHETNIALSSNTRRVATQYEAHATGPSNSRSRSLPNIPWKSLLPPYLASGPRTNARQGREVMSISSPLHLTLPTIRSVDCTGMSYSISRETAALLSSLEAIRAAHGLHPLHYLARLGTEAQSAATCADALCYLPATASVATDVPPPARAKGADNANADDDASSQSSTDDHASDNLPLEFRARAQLIGPEGLGGLATGECWRGGKYRRHAFPLRQRCGGSVTPVRSVAAAAESWVDGSLRYADDDDVACPCHTYNVYKTVADPMWRFVGVGKSAFGGGRWFVHLAP